MSTEDHDLLIQLSKDVEYIKEAVDELKTERVACEDKCDGRIDKLEKKGAYAMGLAAGISFIISFFIPDWLRGR